MRTSTKEGEHSLLNFAERYKKELDGLNLPPDIVVASGSEIKVNAVKEALRFLFPGREFRFRAISVSSEINEQPVGNETITGAENRLKNAEAKWTDEAPKSALFISIENGLFEEKIRGDTRWVDKAVVVIKLPDGRMASFVSGGVIFPKEAVEATSAKSNAGFKSNIVGTTLVEMGFVKNKQDPQSDLTRGAFTRNQQMVGAIMGALIRAGG
ncbi:TPA: hypothetical protein DIU27_03445 [Candidatus Collierbacteria bacterium]|uniref:inosine/xanthosine triphosphatase n=1 Tax=Candidatus Collierbacteria bacterium GW2011_GWB2_44_22 TaxID=1618387 RepID=A0A0G1I0A5_9BACT|nr:MAG: hypothetical protein UW31_C0007G0011 [Candidatus Collierbacteria bacterium GW2011_GWA2_44_13]KKT52243.1 MAG: hypothetical protein UW44_C0003G0086 [Candidatus Collierbacteria bacterium GW2011_GWB2_44_22]KKT62393.1 MAG: hypothetical protein UW56_C0007G0001 [Candidatus Collierbacteria bacterium GW2011_GWD1_44_27]KKT69079.1 MAG: hypothetical protein UW64_C0004G0001 [Microgenomates group bacterium GW2011_GWC1_44_37]KKT89250.1 MAG: hypothetical protein UW88_C0004G0031 [Candidatus Collierbacte